VLITLRRLEDRGEIRGGRFVSGFLGEQFALPIAVDSLRASRNRHSSGEDLPPQIEGRAPAEIVTVSAADPLNLSGIIVPGERVAANSGKVVAFRDGVALPPEERESVISIAASR
jgi:ATP-dependent helicase Lhr and Lhr-like helicase